MDYEILQTKTYNIYRKSILFAKAFTGDIASTPIAIEGPYKYNTGLSEKIPPVGNITTNIETGVIEIEYTPKDDFIGVDTFEYIINLTDKDCRVVFSINVRENILEENKKEIFIEEYIQGGQITTFNKVFTPQYIPQGFCATSVSFSSVDKNMNWSYETFHHDYLNRYGVIKNPVTEVEVQTVATINEFRADYNMQTLRSVENLQARFIKNSPHHSRTEYFTVRFRDIVNEYNGETSTFQEHINLILHMIPLQDDVHQPENPNVPPMEGFDKPEFIIADVEMPDSVIQKESATPSINKFCGNLFENTQAHEEFDGRQTSTIKVGRTVPDHGVNLAYYRNKVASMDDIISIMETDTNKVNVVYAEDWIHLRNLEEKKDSLFPAYIEFVGEKGSDLENYTGTLYREYIIWEESTEKDYVPKWVTVFQEYKGLKQSDLDNLSIFWEYKDETHSGTLEMTHNIIDAIDFYRDKDYYPYAKTYQSFARYDGLVYKDRILYHGSAKYGGMIVEDIGLKNIDPDEPKEIIMYPDANCTLHDTDGNKYIDDDQFVITDVFKDGVPLYYKHRLKHRVYDPIGVDDYGVYKNDSIVVILDDGTIVDDEEYKWTVLAEKTKWDNIYDIYVYTSFVPTFNMAMYVLYDAIPQEAYDGKDLVNPSYIMSGVKERLSVYEAMDSSQYTVSKNGSIDKQSTITMNQCTILNDARVGVDIQYKILVDEKYESGVFKCRVINYKYALSSEKNKYIDGEQVVSPLTNRGFVSAKDMFLQTASPDDIEKITNKSTFRIRYDIDHYDTIFNKDKVVMYTNPFGGGLVMAITYEDTGFPNPDDFNKLTGMLPPYHIYKEENGLIYKGYSVKCKNVDMITVHPPKVKHQLKKWHPTINYSYFTQEYERIDKMIKIIYSVPEYHSQVFGDDGSPYIEIKDEKVEVVGKHLIKTFRSPLRIKHDLDVWTPTNISIKKKLFSGHTKELTISAYDFMNGVIEVEENISQQDTIIVSYEYEEEFYHYPGFYENGDPTTQLIDLNLNPSMYSTYTSNLNEVFTKENVYNLFNKTIYFYLKPMRIVDTSNGKILEENKFTLYHTIGEPKPEGNFDINIGRIFIRHHTSLKSTELIDSRSRGGGVIESMKDSLRRQLEPESDQYFDIGTMDGLPYHENSVVLVKIDEKLLIRNGGRFTEKDIEQAVAKWGAYGMYPIIRYVSNTSAEDMPANTIEIESSITNLFDYRPFIVGDVKKM